METLASHPRGPPAALHPGNLDSPASGGGRVVLSYVGVEYICNITTLKRLACTIQIYFLKSSYLKDTTLC